MAKFTLAAACVMATYVLAVSADTPVRGVETAAIETTALPPYQY